MGNLPEHLTLVVERIILFKPEEYLDPGSGSLIIQVLVASLVGVGFAFRSFWGKLFRRITGKPMELDEEDLEDEDGEE